MTAAEAMDAINRQLVKAAPAISAEVASSEQGWLLVITADGDEAQFPVVDRIVAKAPPIAGWQIVALRQPNLIGGERIRIDDKEVELAAVRVVPIVEGAGERFALEVYVPGCVPDDETFLQITFLILDHTIGERDMETRIGGIRCHPLTDAPRSAIALADLAKLLRESAPGSGAPR
jgi:hypothetical protein